MCAFIDIKRKRNTLQKEVKDNYQEWIKYKKMLTKYKMANVFNSKYIFVNRSHVQFCRGILVIHKIMQIALESKAEEPTAITVFSRSK